MKNRKSTLTAVIVAFVFGAAVVSTAYAAHRCNTSGAVACRQAYFQCVRSTGGDPEGTCESNYNQCLLSNGCPIP